MLLQKFLLCHYSYPVNGQISREVKDASKKFASFLAPVIDIVLYSISKVKSPKIAKWKDVPRLITEENNWQRVAARAAPRRIGLSKVHVLDTRKRCFREIWPLEAQEHVSQEEFETFTCEIQRG